MNGLKKLFDGKRIRSDRMNPLVGLALVGGLMIGQKVLIDGLVEYTAGPQRMVVSVDVGASGEDAMVVRHERGAGTSAAAHVIFR